MQPDAIREKISLPTTAENLQKYFKNIASHFDKYEERTSQKNMIRSIVKAFKLGEHALIEAPTGTGKSLAYLLAFLAVWEQFENKKGEDDEDKERKPKLCIATNTIALQEQLMHKDIPAFQELIGVDFQTALIKGRSNYICNRNIDKIVNDPDSRVFHSLEDAQQFGELQNEVYDAKGKLIEGDRSHIDVKVNNSLWEVLTTDSNNCTGNKCPFYKDCFFYKAKEKNSQADVFVTNHAMFFADLKVQIETDFEMTNLVLPHYDFVVFDEAHNLEDVASNFLGKSISRIGVKRLCSEIINQITKGDLAEEMSKEMALVQEMTSIVQSIDTMNDEFFKKVIEYSVDEKTHKPLTIKRMLQVPHSLKNFIFDIKEKFKDLEDIWRKVNESCDFSTEQKAVRDSLSSRSFDIKLGWTSFLEQSKADYVYWVETPDRGKTPENRFMFASVCQSPVSVAPTLSEHLFERMDSVILTSATLGTDNLNYMASRLGINRYIGAMFHSPFDYKEQSRLYVPQKALNPKAPNYDDYATEEVKELVKISKGRTLVLFTSYYMMNNMADKLKPYIEGELGFRLLKQGDMQRTPLINAFRDDTHSVLFATSSYWEGIDVQGDSLSSVIITKLPFEVPDQPIIEARMEYLQQTGKNPFMDYQVPMAIMKFKQGFGRLIRSTADQGVVTVLDNRLVTMHYGKKFLNSLPPMPVTRNLNEIKSFFEQQ